MVAATDITREAYPPLSLPGARFTGEAVELNGEFNGASRLANFVVQRAAFDRPEQRVQIAGWLRRGRLQLAAVYRAPTIGSLFVELTVGSSGRQVQLVTLHKNSAQEQRTWVVTWRCDGGELRCVARCNKQWRRPRLRARMV